MPEKKLCEKEQLDPQVVRQAIVDNRALVARLLDMDAGMDNDQFYTELLRLCLFDKQRRTHPAAIFMERLNNGDFLLVQPWEDPDNLAPNREPMTDDMLDEAVERVNADAVYWHGKPTASAIDIVRGVILAS